MHLLTFTLWTNVYIQWFTLFPIIKAYHTHTQHKNILCIYNAFVYNLFYFLKRHFSAMLIVFNEDILYASAWNTLVYSRLSIERIIMESKFHLHGFVYGILLPYTQTLCMIVTAMTYKSKHPWYKKRFFLLAHVFLSLHFITWHTVIESVAQTSKRTCTHKVTCASPFSNPMQHHSVHEHVLLKHTIWWSQKVK